MMQRYLDRMMSSAWPVRVAMPPRDIMTATQTSSRQPGKGELEPFPEEVRKVVIGGRSLLSIPYGSN